MIYTIENKNIKIAVDTAGAQLQSIFSKKTGTEYLWQGDSAYWSGRAYNLFPTIGRMYKNIYTFEDKEYTLPCHGVARYRAFTLLDRTATKLVFRLTEDEDSMLGFPFRFTFDISYEIKDSSLNITFNVNNPGEKDLIFGLGGHPGFNIPFAKGNFEDYYIEFAEKTNVMFHTLSENKFMSGEKIPLPLQNGTILNLQHELFDNDAVVLGNTCRRVALKSKVSPEYISVDYPGFRYLGLWHPVKTDAPFVCIEPWSALPATEGIIDALETKNDMNHLAPSKSYETTWTIGIHED